MSEKCLFLSSKLTREESGMHSLNAFKRRIRKRDLTDLIKYGFARNDIYATG